jgi:hypothetical protein
VIDDYAHHPTKIKATLAAARMRYPGRRSWLSGSIILTHAPAPSLRTLFSRLKTPTWSSFQKSTLPRKTEAYSSKELVQQMDLRKALYIAGIPEISPLPIRTCVPGDVLVVLSAGDADQDLQIGPLRSGRKEGLTWQKTRKLISNSLEGDRTPSNPFDRFRPYSGCPQQPGEYEDFNSRTSNKGAIF